VQKARGRAQGGDPAGEAALEGGGVEAREDVAEGVVGGDAVGQAQGLPQPVVVRLAVQFDVGPGVLAADGGSDGDGNDVE
jgi:hypothetical protein